MKTGDFLLYMTLKGRELMSAEVQEVGTRWLAQAGLRPTRQRVTLASLLVGDGQDRHVTAESLFEAAKGQGEAKTIAKKLSELGFSSTYIVDGGFSGRGGWTSSKLGSQNYFRGNNRIPFFQTEVVDSGGTARGRALPGGRK